MAEILLTSEAFLKENFAISDNVAGKYIQPAIREAQEIGLRSILGETLFSKLKSLVQSGAISQPANSDYKELLDRSQYYLGYTAIVELTMKVSLKIGNFGVAKSSDENLQVASMDEIEKQQYFYQTKADACCLDLQNWLLDNRAKFPELTQNTAHKIKSNLYSAATSGLWLGGRRGKIVRRG